MATSFIRGNIRFLFLSIIPLIPDFYGYTEKIQVGFVEDRKLLPPTASGRRKDKVSMVKIDPTKDIPVDVIKHTILDLLRAYDLYIHHKK